ncbi:UPF0676 protein C1494.01 [Folsomia candida]|nr:UPF0676 protein C1494.01 [Folsomia candida]
MGSLGDSTIPVVDLSPLAGKYEDLNDAVFGQLVEKVGQAFNEVGFVYIVNHGVDMDKIEHIHKLSKGFFTMSAATKNKYKKPNAAINWHGYSGPGDEFLNEAEKNSTELREMFDAWGFEQFDEKHFPTEVPGYKDAFDAVRPECNNVGKKLLRLLGKYLHLDDDELFVKAHSFMNNPTKIRTHSQFRTLHYYPMEPNDPSIPPNAIRCGEHADWGTITLLFQDMVGGLEVKRLDGSWIEATPIEGSILVNIAQLMELWSAGIFRATPHRVRILDVERIRKTARQSFIYFINPDGDYVVKPVVKCPPGDEEYLERTPIVAYDHYLRLMADATLRY